MINRCSACWFDNINILLHFSALLKVIGDRINNLKLNKYVKNNLLTLSSQLSTLSALFVSNSFSSDQRS